MKNRPHHASTAKGCDGCAVYTPIGQAAERTKKQPRINIGAGAGVTGAYSEERHTTHVSPHGRGEVSEFAKASIAPLVSTQRLMKGRAVKIGPERIGDI